MSLTPGTRLGPYEVTAQIGVGGMGEVYRARDTNLARQVAIKVLPDSMAADAERLARFDREAKTLAALNHPNIAAIYGLERSEGQTALVMELVEGPTLADRIAEGPIPVDDALAVAKQIAEALEAAHEQGIIHRDLKPANIKVRPDGTVKVLDFGLSKAVESKGTLSPGLSQSPTITTPAMTQAGLILGTAAYMSPEQANGKPADKRSDIWAFGCVLYEMVTGRRAFPGDELSETLAFVLAREPDWDLVPDGLSPAVLTYLRRCLDKKPKQRIHDIADVRLALEGAFESSLTARSTMPTQREGRAWQRTGVVALLTACVASAIAGSAVWVLKPSPPSLVTRSRFVLPEGQQFTNDTRQLVALSPDGTQMAYVANYRLFLRRLSELEARPIQGTESGIVGPSSTSTPVFSPDGRSIAYYDRAFKKISVDGGTPVTLGQGDPPSGMSWSENFIVVGQGSKGILRVSANGGRPEQLVTVESGERAVEPQMLPGNRIVLFTLASSQSVGPNTWEAARIVAQALDSGERETIVEGGNTVRYLPTGHLIYALGGTLFAVPFDPQRLETRGGAVPVVEGVRQGAGYGLGAFYSVSAAGSLVFVPGPVSGSTAERQLAFVDRTGAVERLPLPQNAYASLRISPNGRQVAFDTDDGKEANVWVYDLSGGSPPHKVTFGGRNRFPIWSADGQRVVFQSDREGDAGLFWQPVDGAGTAQRLTKSDEGTSHVPESWSLTGERFSFSVTAKSGVSLWTFSIPEKKATVFGAVRSTAPLNSEFSPDGRWLAYTLRTASTANVYVEPFPATGAKMQITTTNGHHPVWLRDGEQLSFRVGAADQVVVRVSTAPTFSIGNTVPVVVGGLPTIELGVSRSYDVTRDGSRFLTVASANGPRSRVGTSEMEIVLNWTEELKRRVPAN